MAAVIRSSAALRGVDLERKYDGQFRVVFEALRGLMQPPDSPKRELGFRAKDS